MADDIRSDIIINVDTSVGIAEIKNLQKQISQLNAQLLQSGTQQAKAAQNIQRNLINNINATGKFAANVRTISTTAESFTNALERNKLGFGETFRYAGASTKTFGRLFKSEFSTIEKVATERVKTIQTQFIKLGRDGSGAMKAISVRPLALDMDDLATKTAIAAQKQQLFNQLLKQGSTNLLNFGKNTQWAGRQLMVGFTIPLAMMGTVAAKTFMEMEEQAIKFRRVYGDTFTATEDTEKMIKQVQRLANEFTKYGVAAEKTMEMAATAAAMGLTNTDLLAQVNEATRLSVLGGVEQEQALETTISLMNAFGVEAKDLAGTIDFLNAVENQTVVAIEDMTIAIPKAAPVVKQLGGDMEDLAFFMTAMKEGGINASEGANALKSGLASLINPAEKTSKFLATLGINIKGIVEANAGDVRGTVIAFANALDTLDPLNRARAIEQLFGKFQFSRLSTLFQNVVKEGTQAQRVAEISRQTAEELAILSERELKRVEDSPMFKFKKAIEDLKVSLVPLGEAFLKAITPVVEFAKGVLERFNNMGDGAKNFVVLLTTVLAGIGPVLLMTIGLVANGVANLIKGFALIGKVFRGTGASSKDLAFSTEYMTQQQLEAAAVAASLDQSHAKLIQTFNVEALAVDKLASAYGRAVLAQSRLLNVPIGPRNPGGQKPMKLRSGIVSVPGPKGAGDIVPAMLSPGEAVIPAKQSEKYAGLIQGMVNDSIPGYRFGRLGAAASSIGSKAKSLLGKVPVSRDKSNSKEWNQLTPPNSEWGLMESVVRTLTGRRENYGRSSTFYENKLADRFLRRSKKDVAVRMFADDLVSSLGRGDKRYKNIFETGGKSRGSLDEAGGQRELAENRLFGFDSKTDPSKRPAYGYMFNRDVDLVGGRRPLIERITGKRDTNDRKAFGQSTIDQSTRLMNPNTYRYGDTAMVLKKRALRGRTTITQGDSLNSMMEQYATPAKFGTRNKKKLEAAKTSGKGQRDFFEAQILGGFSFKDIKRIVSTEPEKIVMLQRALREAGIKGIKVGMPQLTMMQRLKKFVYGKKVSVQRLPRTQPEGSGQYTGLYRNDPFVLGGRTFWNKGGVVEQSDAIKTIAKRSGNMFEFGTVSVPEVKDIPATEYEIDVKDRPELARIQAEVDRLIKGDFQKGITARQGRDIVDLVLENYGKDGANKRFTLEKFKKFAIPVAEMMPDGVSPTKLGQFFGESAKTQEGYRGAPGSLPKFETMLKDSKLDPSLRASMRALQDVNERLYYSVLGDPQTVAGYDAEVRKAVKTGTEVPDKATWLANKAYEVTRFDPLNRDVSSGLERGHGAGNYQFIKRSPLGWELGPATSPDFRVANNFISTLTDTNKLDESGNPKTTAVYDKLKDLTDRYPNIKIDGKEMSTKTLLSKMLSNATLSPAELKLLGKFAELGVLDGTDKKLTPGAARAFRSMSKALTDAKITKPDGSEVKKANLDSVIDTTSKVLSKDELAKRVLGTDNLKTSRPKGFTLRGRTIFGFNKGVVSVPGQKGKGDIVPAMLSPGEAVIPAKQSKKYAGLIQGMVEDNLPGYRIGRIGYRVSKTAKAKELKAETFDQDKLGGTPGGMRTLDGEKYYVKRLESKAEATSEILSSALFSSMGNRGPRLQMVNSPDSRTVASKIIPGLVPSDRDSLRDWIAKQKNPRKAAEEVSSALKRYIEKDVPFNAAVGNIDAHSQNILFNPKTKRFENIDLGNNTLAGFAGLPNFGALAYDDTIRMKSDVFGSVVDNIGRGQARGVFKSLEMTPSGSGTSIARDASSEIDRLASLLGFDLKKTSRRDPATIPANNKFIQKLIAENPSLASQLDFGKLSGTSGKTLEEALRTLHTRLERAKNNAYQFYAKGVLSVPGPKGKGDVVPAMLSPGEAVIPAKESKKYSSLIEQMIYGKIPGYQESNVPRPPGMPPASSPQTGSLPPGPAPGILPPTPLGNSQGTVGSRPGTSPFLPTDDQVEKSGRKFGLRAFSPKTVTEGARTLGSGFVSVVKKSYQSAASNAQLMIPHTWAADSNSYADLADGRVRDNASGKVYANQDEMIRDNERNRQIKNARVAGTSYMVPSATGNRVFTFDQDGKAKPVTGDAKQQFLAPAASARNAAMQDLDEDGKPKPKERVRDRYSAAMGKITGGAGMAAGGAMMGAMMLGMGEGPMAKMANDMMPYLLAASIAIPLMGSIAGAIVVALGSMVAAVMLLNAKFDDAQKKVLEYSEAMKASNKAMTDLAKFAGNVTASEAMDRRRTERDRELGAVPGKTTFGEAFVETELGKKQTEALAKQIASGNRAGSVKDMTSQLTSSVLSGALDFSQARSLAANLSLEAGDASIAIDVIANMEKLLGPNGSDLLTDPLQVRINALQANQEAMRGSLATANAGVQTNIFGVSGSSGNRIGAAVGGALGGAAAAMAITAPIAAAATASTVGALAAPAAAAVVIAGAVGAIAGAFGAYKLTEQSAEDYGKLGAAAAVDAKIALEQNKELLDSMDLFYEKKVEELRIQGKINEATEMQEKYILGERKTLTDAMAAVNKDILKGFNDSTDLQESLMSGAAKATDARYKDDPDQITYLESVRAQSNMLEATEAQQYLIELKMASGEIPPATMRKLLGIAAGDETAQDAVLKIITNFSGDAAGRTAELGAMLGDEKLARDLTLKVSAQPSDGDAQDLLNNISELTRIGSVIPAKLAVDFYLTDEDAYKSFNELMDNINAKKPKTIKAILEIAPELKGKITKEEEAYFNTLSDDQKVVYTKTLVSQLFVPEAKIIASDDYKAWLNEDVYIDGIRYGGVQHKGEIDEVLVARYRAGEAFKATSSLAPAAPKTTGGGGGGGGGARNEPLDDPLRRLKEIRDSRINAKGGKKELMRLLGGNKDITRFKGLEQLLMQQGGSSEFIDYLMGLDEADQKKFFTTNKKTGAVTLTDQGKATDKAFDEIALGEFQTGMMRATVDVNNQNVALQRLVASGMSVSEAYATVEDAALAAAIATKDLSNEELKKITDEAKRAEKALRQFAAAKALREDIDNTNRDLRVTERFAEGATKFDFAEQQAILQDSNLREIYGQFLSGEIDKLPAVFKDRLQQVVNSIEFKEGLFSDGLNKAMDKFAAEERAIDVKAELSIVGDRKIAELAQNEIAALQFEIDDYQAGLQEIAWKEEEINKAYDKKYEALEKIADVNQQITAQQQKQLSLADALSRGDISAAARAAQEMRDQSARDAVNSQKESLQRAQKLQTDALLSKSGLNRQQLEEKVLANQKKVFEIEESRLEPAQENIRIAEANASLRKQEILVAGKTRLQWDEISNNIEVARVNGVEYTRAIDGALSVVKNIQDYYSDPASRVSNVQSLFTEKQMAGAVNNFNDKPVAVATGGPSSGGDDGGPVITDPPTDPPTDPVKDLVKDPVLPQVPLPLGNAPALGAKANQAMLTGLGDKAQVEFKGAIQKQFQDKKAEFEKKYNLAYKQDISQVAIADRPAYQKAMSEFKISVRTPEGVTRSLSLRELDILKDQYNYDTLFGSIDDAKAVKESRQNFIKRLPTNIQQAMFALKTNPQAIGGRKFMADKARTAAAFDKMRPTLNKFGYDYRQSLDWNLKQDPSLEAELNKQKLLKPYLNLVAEMKKQKVAFIGYRKLLLDNGYNKANLAWHFNDDTIDWTKQDFSGVESAPGKSLLSSINVEKLRGYNSGGRVIGGDTVPAMLTPGEFVVRKYAVQNFGVDRLKSINNGTYKGDSMYNYEVNVNVQTDSNPDQIARAVMSQIKQIDSQRIRGNKF